MVFQKFRKNGNTVNSFKFQLCPSFMARLSSNFACFFTYWSWNWVRVIIFQKSQKMATLHRYLCIFWWHHAFNSLKFFLCHWFMARFRSDIDRQLQLFFVNRQSTEYHCFVHGFKLQHAPAGRGPSSRGIEQNGARWFHPCTMNSKRLLVFIYKYI